VPDTTPTPDAPTEQENWQQRYIGLQKVVASRDTALNTSTAALDALQAEHEAALTELATYRQKAVDAGEEAAALAQYEALQARFEPPAPKPIRNNPARNGAASDDWLAPRERATRDVSEGFPT
jgi:hypothetical protein